MTDWKEVKLGDIGEIVTGKTPLTKIDAYWGGNIPFVTPKDIQGSKHIFQTERYLSDDGMFSVKSCILPKDAICVSCIGNIGYVSMTTERSVSNQQINSIVTNNENDANFVYYLMRSLWPYFKNYEGQSTTLSIFNKSQFSKIDVCIPKNRDIQKKIAGVLGALDDKIELNNKINQNLEQQAQAIFKSWFIDFEPFGGTMPTDWKVGTFSELITDTVGGDWGKDEIQNNYTEEVYCIRGADIPDVKIGNKGKMPKRYILLKNYLSKKLNAGDLVVEISGGSPTQSTGRIAAISDYLLKRYEEKVICTNFCKALKPKINYSEFIYHYWQYLYDKNVFFSYENGTTGIKNLDMSGFLEMEQIHIPTQEIITTFSKLCGQFFKQIYFNGLENEKLAQLRDALLPKLMSGEIDVSNVDISDINSADKLSFSEE